jgi:hypothetical protein
VTDEELGDPQEDEVATVSRAVYAPVPPCQEAQGCTLMKRISLVLTRTEPVARSVHSHYPGTPIRHGIDRCCLYWIYRHGEVKYTWRFAWLFTMALDKGGPFLSSSHSDGFAITGLGPHEPHPRLCGLPGLPNGSRVVKRTCFSTSLDPIPARLFSAGRQSLACQTSGPASLFCPELPACQITSTYDK